MVYLCGLFVAAAAPIAAAPGYEPSRGNASRGHSRVNYWLVVDNMKIFSRFWKFFHKMKKCFKPKKNAFGVFNSCYL